jgi:hypothetical protein
MLTYRRPHTSRTTTQFIEKYLLSIPGAFEDVHGNIHVDRTNGTSRVLWSAHTDTVHRSGGRQTVILDADGKLRRRASATDCLGADDGVGCFILREMCLAGIAGYYLFHHGEERGGIGSGALAHTSRDWLSESFDYAIAFDRRNHGDVITSQVGSRCASNQFAKSLARILRTGGLPGYHPSSGVYTDTAEYAEFIPECSNVSVGYKFEHTPDEELDTIHVGALLGAILSSWDESRLVCKRVPMPWQASQPKARITPESDLATRIADGTLSRDYSWYESDGGGRHPVDDVRFRVRNGVCTICEWPMQGCRCTEEDVTFWRYLNGER